MSSLLTTPLHALHQQLGARMVPFCGWDMPLHYGSQIQEHVSVRQHCGCFDVSHMAIFDLVGERTALFLLHLLANDITRLTHLGKALYSCMLNTQGGVIDDLIVYWLGGNHYRLISNAATRHKVSAWIRQQALPFNIDILERRDLAMIAVQGPTAARVMTALLPAHLRSFIQELPPFFSKEAAGFFVARTGYTGENGFEVLLKAELAVELWNQLIAEGVTPCGLAARDSLRLEAGMSLYGNEMDESTTPDDAGLGWTVALSNPNRDFIGRAALEAQRQGELEKTIKGLILNAKGVCRAGMDVLLEDGRQGVVTSGGFSPVLNRGIALVRIPPTTSERVSLLVRGRNLPARLVTPPFVQHGRPCIKPDNL